MANIVITTHTAGKCVEVDFGDLFGNPAFPFIKVPRAQYYRGHVYETAPFEQYLRIFFTSMAPLDLYPHMVDTVDGVPINTMAELESAIVNIIVNNLV